MNRALLIKLGTACLLLISVSLAHSDDASLWHALLPDACFFTGDFSQKKQLAGLPAPLVSEGNFLFYCDSGLIWNSLSPFSESLIYTDNNIHYRFQKKRLQPLSGNAHKALAKILIALMRADTAYIDKHFAVSAQLPLDDDSLVHVTLKPKRKLLQKAVRYISLKKTHQHRVLFSIHGHGDDATEITMSNVAAVVATGVATGVEANNTDFYHHCMHFFDLGRTPCEALRYPQRYWER
ncbi:MAG: outer membrane lipoprotein carrier protein LolA [Cellvibrionaceae bacterium]|nr:outer membrane lipoprotein carrier protein LolA [Cellvibrionaceae bacterium]